MQKAKLLPNIKALVKNDDELQVKIAKANGVRVTAVLRWLLEDSSRLADHSSLKAIREYYKYPETKKLFEFKSESKKVHA